MHGLKVNLGKQRWQRFDGDVLGIQWKDDKVVSMLSTIHKGSDSVWCRRRCKDPHTGRFSIKVLKQPKAIQDYNRNIKGVDQSDQLIGSYSVLWKVKKYWKVLFFHLIDVSIVNAFVLWKEYQSQHPERADLQRPKGYDQLASREALVWQLVSIEEADPGLSGGSNPSYQKMPGMEPLTSQLLTAVMVDVKCVRHLESNLTPMSNVRHVMLFYVSTTTETAFMCIIP